MTITDSIKWRIDDTAYELERKEECRGVFIYKRGDQLPQYFTAQEAGALCMQIRRIMDRADFQTLASNMKGL